METEGFGARLRGDRRASTRRVVPGRHLFSAGDTHASHFELDAEEFTSILAGMDLRGAKRFKR